MNIFFQQKSFNYFFLTNLLYVIFLSINVNLLVVNFFLSKFFLTHDLFFLYLLLNQSYLRVNDYIKLV